MKEATSTRIRFGAFELDLKAGELHKGGRRVRLQEQPFQVLRMLVERAGEVVSREEMQDRLWPNDTIVEFDHGINTAIRKLRNALDDSAEKPNYIETVARRGYRFIMAVESLPSSSDAIGSPTVPVAGAAAAAKTKMRSSALAPGRTVSHYRVLNVIGGGGMGVVYRAEDLKLGRSVALKFLPEEIGNDPIALGRFEREARTASSLNHPNICTIYEVEEHEGTPFIVMEYMEGQTLRDYIAQTGISGALDKPKRHLPMDEVVDIATQVAAGLDAAHQKAVIHRDIKPANIFITRQRQVKILDFGLAKLITATLDGDERQEAEAIVAPPHPDGEQGPDTNLTREGASIGTLGYMSPEQVQGLKLDSRTDLFCFGLVLYEMVTGKRAFGAGTRDTFREAVLYQTPTPVNELNPMVPPKLEEVINRCLQKERGERYQHASDLLTDLKRIRRAVSPSATARILVPQEVAGKAALAPVAEKARAQPAPFGKWTLAAIIAVALAAGLFVGIRTSKERAGNGPNTASIAVLPFTDLSAGKDEAYFSDGLTEQLISDLTRVPGLDVVARSSAFQFKGKNEDLRTVGKKLNVANILEGTVRREGNRVHITADLTKVDGGFQLWSRSYDREIGDIFAVQEEIARAVVGELQVKLTGARAAPFATQMATTTPEAYQAYLQARYYSRSPDPAGREKALAYADESIQLDSKYAPSWALRSSMLSALAVRSAINMEEGFSKARESARKAIELDPGLADAYLAMARIQVYHDFDMAAAQSNLLKAADLEPGNADVYLARAAVAQSLGQLDTALDFEKKAFALDPLHGYSLLAQTLYYKGQYADAENAVRKEMELNPRMGVLFTRGAILLVQNKAEQALATFREENWEPFRLVGEAMALYALGQKKQSDDALNTLIAKHKSDAGYQIGQAYAFRNEAEKAMEWFNRGYEQHDGALINLKVDPLLKNLHQDRQYRELLNKMRL